MVKTKHYIERTTPTGKGIPFVGTCRKCGKTNLTADQTTEWCENIANISDDESMIMAIEGGKL